jgi:hypothetical protein
MAGKNIRKGMTVFIISLLLICSGCSRVTQENYDKLSVGMDYEEVVKILGEPSECKSILNAKNCIWGNSSKRISVKLIANKVVFLSSEGLK